MKRLALAILVLVVVLGAGPGHAQEPVVAVIEDRAAAHGVSGSYLVRVARCESNLDPRAVGAAGEQGLFQLHARGLRPLFFQWGYADPFNAWESADFAARAFAAGLSRHWSCA
jgi:hypothetical protein